MADSFESSDSMKSKGKYLEVTGVSRSGRIRKKSCKLMDFECCDEVESRHEFKPNLTEEVPLPQQKKKRTPNIQSDQEVKIYKMLNQPEDDGSFIAQDSDPGSKIYHPTVDKDDEEYGVDEEDVNYDYDYNEGRLVLEKTSTQFLYMKEKSKKKLIIKNDCVVRTTKSEQRDEGKTHSMAYMMWAKEVHQELIKQYSNMDLTTMGGHLSRLRDIVPNLERELLHRKAKREASKKPKVIKLEASLMPSRNIIYKSTQVQQHMNCPHASTLTSHISPSIEQTQVQKDSDQAVMTDVYQVSGTAPIDVAAHLKLLGESLSTIGEQLQEHKGQITGSGSLSLLLDSLLCAVGPLMCLTQQVDELEMDTHMLSETLQNTAYLMPGLENNDVIL